MVTLVLLLISAPQDWWDQPQAMRVARRKNLNRCEKWPSRRGNPRRCAWHERVDILPRRPTCTWRDKAGRIRPIQEASKVLPAARLRRPRSRADEFERAGRKVHLIDDRVRPMSSLPCMKRHDAALEGRLGAPNGYLHFEPLRGRLGSLPIPLPTTLEADSDHRIMDSPRSREVKHDSESSACELSTAK